MAHFGFGICTCEDVMKFSKSITTDNKSLLVYNFPHLSHDWMKLSESHFICNLTLESSHGAIPSDTTLQSSTSPTQTHYASPPRTTSVPPRTTSVPPSRTQLSPPTHPSESPQFPPTNAPCRPAPRSRRSPSTRGRSTESRAL